MASAFGVPEFETWPVCQRLAAHVRAVASHVTEDSGALASLLGTTGTYLQERAALAEVVPLYERTRAIFEGLAAADPGNAGWQRDVWVSLWRLAKMEGSGVSWAQVLERMEAMKACGVLLPTDEPFLEAGPHPRSRQLGLAERSEVVGWVERSAARRAAVSGVTCGSIQPPCFGRRLP